MQDSVLIFAEILCCKPGDFDIEHATVVPFVMLKPYYPDHQFQHYLQKWNDSDGYLPQLLNDLHITDKEYLSFNISHVYAIASFAVEDVRAKFKFIPMTLNQTSLLFMGNQNDMQQYLLNSGIAKQIYPTASHSNVLSTVSLCEFKNSTWASDVIYYKLQMIGAYFGLGTFHNKACWKRFYQYSDGCHGGYYRKNENGIHVSGVVIHTACDIEHLVQLYPMERFVELRTIYAPKNIITKNGSRHVLAYQST